MRTFVSVLAVICTCLMLPWGMWAEEPPASMEGAGGQGLHCEQVVFCAGVKDRAPVGVAETFPSDIFSVFCFTTIVGAEDTTTVVHNWYHDDTKMATVEFSVGSAHWRTWSSKRMATDWKGPWRVDVATADGVVIGSGKFILE
jgi:hypothetical protein